MDFVAYGLVLATDGTVAFFFSDVFNFFELLWAVGCRGKDLDVLLLDTFEVGGFVDGEFILSGTVTVSVLALGVISGDCIVTDMAVPDNVVERGFIVDVESTGLTAEAAAATLLARLSRRGFLEVSAPLRLAEAAVAVTFDSCGKIGSKGERLGLKVSASLHCFLMYLQ